MSSSSIKFQYLERRVYTPGYLGLAHPSPQDTRPVREERFYSSIYVCEITSDYVTCTRKFMGFLYLADVEIIIPVNGSTKHKELN